MTKIMPNDGTKLQRTTSNHLPPQSDAAQLRKTDGQPAAKPGADKADISTRAHEMADLRTAVDVGRKAMSELPDVRAEKIAQARERLAEGFYRSSEVREQVAGRLASMFMDHPLF